MEVATVISCGGALWDHMDGSISGASRCAIEMRRCAVAKIHSR
jgi:hypothetical protein